MRALMELIEGDRHILPTAALSAVAPEVLLAARRAGIVRPDDPGFEDLSAADLARVLRALYGLLGRGRPVPAAFAEGATTLGWSGEREVLLCARPRTGLARALARARPTLVLVPSARHLTQQHREKHGPGARVEIEALEESLAVLGGRLVRRAAIAPDAPGFEVSQRDPVPARPPRPSPEPPAIPLTGFAKRWVDIRICKVDPTTVRIDVGRRHLRCTHADFGMAHAYTRRPTLEWEVVEELCDQGGYFRTNRFGTANATKQLISRTGRRLSELFGIRGSPFHRYRSDCGWRARFEASRYLAED